MTDLTPAQHSGIQQILGLMETHNLSLSDIKKSAKEKKQAIKSGNKPKLTKGELILRLFAYLGGTLIFAGLGVFIETIWEDISSLPRVILTFGTGFTAYLCGLVFASDKRFEKVATPAFILAFIMQPTGLFVLLKEYFGGDNAALGSMIVFGPLALQQFLTFTKFRFTSLLLFSLLYLLGFAGAFVEHFDLHRGMSALMFGTFLLLTTIHLQLRDKFKDLTPFFFMVSTIIFFSGVYYFVGRTVFDPIALSLIFTLLGFAVIRESKTLYVLCMIYLAAYFCGGPGGGWIGNIWTPYAKITAIVTGLSLVSAGEWLKRINYISLFPVWMFIGTAYALAGIYGLLHGTIFEFIYIAFAGLALYGALLISSRAVLAASVLSLISFIIGYSAEHFADTIGWPILLIMIGILVLAAGFVFAKLSGQIKQAKT